MIRVTMPGCPATVGIATPRWQRDEINASSPARVNPPTRYRARGGHRRSILKWPYSSFVRYRPGKLNCTTRAVASDGVCS